MRSVVTKIASRLSKTTANHDIRYDTIRYINVRSKAEEMASLIWRTAQKRKNEEKIKSKTE